MPDPILDTLENVARILKTIPPPKESDWQYLKDAPPIALTDGGTKRTSEGVVYFGM